MTTVIKTATRIAALAVIGLAGASTAHAQAFTTLYSFAGLTGDQTTTAVSSGAPTNAVASVISRGSGITASAGADAMSSSGWSTTGLSTTDYYEVSVTPNSGFVLNMSQVRFNMRSSGSGATTAEIRSSLDSFGAAIGATITVPTSGTAGVGTTTSLTSATYQNVSTPITFRIYGYNAGGAGGTTRLQNGTFGGLEISGAVAAAAIPEPSTVALLGLSLLPGAALLRRRRK